MQVSISGGFVAVLCVGDADFLTIDCLERFTLLQGDQRLRGTRAVEAALRAQGIKSWYSEASGAPLGNQTSVAQVALAGSYLPFATLAVSPVFCQFLLPASSVPDLLSSLLALEEAHFREVRGKLPLHVGLLVANRKFPLYALVEAGQQILNHPVFGDGARQDPRRDGGQSSEFYRYYPTREPGARGFNLTDLLPLGTGAQFWLTPGFFDFDLLGATTDRHRLRYEAASSPVRRGIVYGWLYPRPMPLQRLGELMEVWELLSKLTPTQRHQIDSALGAKLEQWRGLGEETRQVFRGFANAILKDAFGRDWSDSLNQDQRNQLLSAADNALLMEAMQLFQHVLKGDAGDE